MANEQDTLPDPWSQICQSYKIFLKKGKDEYFVIGKLAVNIKSDLVGFLGCDPNYVRHYEYIYGATPEYDRYDEVKNGWDSTRQNAHGWTIGIGLLLEIAPNTYPKTTIVFPVDIIIKGDSYVVSSPIFDNVNVSAEAPKYAQDLRVLSSSIKDGILSTLSGEGKNKNSVGFIYDNNSS